MANLTTDAVIRLTGASINTETNQLTFSGATRTNSTYSINDTDSSGTMTSGDYMQFSSVPYTGYTVDIGGAKFAIFSGFGAYWVPLDTDVADLLASDFSSPMTVEAANGVGVANCFMGDTQIATPQGEVVVDLLEPGDEICLHDGTTARVRWVAKQTLMPVFGLPERNRIIEIAPGALGDGLPHSPLRLTADHALLLDGVLVHAGALINGDTIRQVPDNDLPRRFTVYHVETEAHAMLLANGAPSETFIDNVPRHVFDNYAEYTALCGADRPVIEAPYPRAQSARQIPKALRARLAGKRRAYA